jgi:hypothetical protein
MNTLRASSFFDGDGHILDQSSSRRAVLRKLGALGLGAGGGLSLVPFAAAKPAHDGKRGRKERGGRGTGEGPSAQVVPIELDDPVVAASLSLGNTQLSDVTAWVSGSITFDGDYVALMQRGHKFRMLAELRGADGGGASTLLATFTSIHLFLPTTRQVLLFVQKFRRAVYDEDNAGSDEIFVRLVLQWGRPGRPWRTVKTYDTNQVSISA